MPSGESIGDAGENFLRCGVWRENIHELIVVDEAKDREQQLNATWRGYVNAMTFKIVESLYEDFNDGVPTDWAVTTALSASSDS